MDNLLSVSEVSKRLGGISKWTVYAWLSQGRLERTKVGGRTNRNNLVLGQRRVDEHSNEITAIPKLLGVLELSGTVVAIDAIGCQKPIAQQILDKQADYILAVKENQAHLRADILDSFQMLSCDAVADRSMADMGA